MLSRREFKNCQKLFLYNKPTNGFRGLFMVLNSAPAKVYITGLTFYKTPYLEGYRDIEKSTIKEDVKDFSITSLSAERGYHDPDLEFSLFWNMLKTCSFPVEVDPKMNRILKKHFSYLKS